VTPLSRVFAEKRGLIWPLVIVLVANVAVYLLVVYPLSQKVAAGEQEATAATLALNNARRDYDNARATVAGKSQADTELQRFYEDVLPPDLSGARRITFLPIEQMAQQANLQLRRGGFEMSTVRESSLSRFAQTAVLTGEYGNIRRFIHQLETRPEFVVIENVDLSQGETDGSGGITVTLQIATYFRTGGDAD
jgi:hypothetical protein